MRTLAAGLLSLLPALLYAGPVRVVFDTDIGNDVDDVLALGMLHSLQSRGHCELAAVTVTKDHPKAAVFADAINTFYGRPDTPIGAVRNGPAREQGRFLGLVDEKTKEGIARYPRDLKNGTDAPEATALLRDLLARSDDKSLVLVQVGFFTNFRRLLASEADAISPLTGRDLIARKVRLLSVMAGAFRDIRGNRRHLEFNVKRDIPSARAVADHWPTAIVWTGFETGIAATYPALSIQRDYEYVPHHPLKEAYYLYKPPPHDRPTWDLIAVLAAVWPDRGHFSLSAPGRVTVEDDGFTRFTREDGGRHRFVTLDKIQVARLREAFVQLCSDPPGKQ